MLDEMREWLRNYINDVCIYRVKPDELEIPSKVAGHPYTWQFYLRRGLFKAKVQSIVGVLFWDMFAEHYKAKPFQIAGLETGSTPLLSAIVNSASLFDIECNAFSIRAERKKYGLFNRFEGIVDYQLPVLLVDDMSNSKNTMQQAMYYCLNGGLEVVRDAFTIINKDSTIEGFDKHIGNQVNIKSIFSLNDFDLEYEDYITKNGNINLVEFIKERGTK